MVSHSTIKQLLADVENATSARLRVLEDVLLKTYQHIPPSYTAAPTVQSTEVVELRNEVACLREQVKALGMAMAKMVEEMTPPKQVQVSIPVPPKTVPVVVSKKEEEVRVVQVITHPDEDDSDDDESGYDTDMEEAVPSVDGPGEEEAEEAEEEAQEEEAAAEEEQEAEEEAQEEEAQAEAEEEQEAEEEAQEEEAQAEAEEEQEEAQEEEEEVALEEFTYKGRTFYRDADGDVYRMDENGELEESPFAKWDAQLQRLQRYTA